MGQLLGFPLLVLAVLPGAFGWILPSYTGFLQHRRNHQQQQQSFVPQQQRVKETDCRATTAPSGSLDTTADTVYRPLFTFNESETAEKYFSRIDDVIMGGVSSSTFIMDPQNRHAKWFGICRTEGGGFCGVRTLPFQEAVPVGDAEGIYVFCRLVSDDEPERRVWKLTTRVNDDRGEQLYQARYYFPPSSGREADDGEKEWSLIKIPFESFQLVRGPRTVPNGPPLNVSGGIYQIGMTMSKFELGANVTELPNFRPGFFEYHLGSIGFYKGQAERGVLDDEVAISVLSEEQAKKKAPIFVRVFRPVSKLFFTEESQRRKVAMQKLREKRGLSRVDAIKYGFRNRAKSQGVVVASATLLATLLVDAIRATVFATVRYGIVAPIRVVTRTFGAISRLFQPKSQNQSDSSEA